MWCKSENFVNIVEQNWNLPARERGMKKIAEKLFRLKQRLKWWNKNVFGNLFQNLKDMEFRVMRDEIEYEANPNEQVKDKLEDSRALFENILELEEEYWKQKANCKWVVDGERNTAMYHSMVKRKHAKSSIKAIEEQGSVLTDLSEIKNSAIGFFQNLFAESLTVSEIYDETIIPVLVDSEINLALCRQPDMEEIKRAIFGLNPEAAAGPDGFTAKFYQFCWNTIHLDLMEACKDFFEGKGKISFWYDEWMQEGTVESQMDVRSEHDLVRVQDLWTEEGRWDVNKLVDLVPHDIMCKIELIRIEDKAVPVWKGTSSGIFTSKSAYDLIRRRKLVNNVNLLVWNKRILPTISIFWWKLLRGWIPVELVVQRKGIELASRCFCCKEGKMESLAHLFLEGQTARDVWNVFNHLFSVNNANSLSCLLKLKSWKNSDDNIGQGHIRVIIPILIGWALWKAKNAAKYDNNLMSCYKVVQSVQGQIHNLHRAIPFEKNEWKGNLDLAGEWSIQLVSKNNLRMRIIRWIRPRGGVIKINTDGARDPVSGNASAAGVARDEEGTLIFGLQMPLGGKSVIEAELLAIMACLKEAYHRSITKIIVESDSMVALHLIRNKNKIVKWNMVTCLQEIMKMVASMDVEFVHIMREGNAAADHLAKEALVTNEFKAHVVLWQGQ